MATDDLDCSLVVDRLSQHLAGADEERYWSACACLWGRTFVEARTAWDRWPEQHDIGLKALGHALARATGHRGLDDPPAAVLEAIRERAVAEDDGAAEWGIALIFFEMAEWALDGTSAQLCLTKAAQVYLEEIFRVIAVELAARMGRPISLADARQRVPADQRWHGAVAFLETI